MGTSKGVTDAGYALMTSAAIMTGLVLLSVAGTPFSLMQGGQQPNLDPGDVQLPGNGSFDPSEHIDPETARKAAEAAQDSGMVTSIARSLFELLAGRQPEGLSNRSMPGGLNRSGDLGGLLNGSTGIGNQSLPGGNQSLPTDGQDRQEANDSLQQPNGTADAGSGDRSGSTGNQTDGTVSDGSGTGNRTTDGDGPGTNETMDGGQDEPDNGTATGQQPSTGNRSQEGNASAGGPGTMNDTDSRPAGGNSSGLLTGIMEGLSSILQGGDGDAQQDGSEQQDATRSEEPGGQQGGQGGGAEASGSPIQDLIAGLLPAVLVVIFLVAALVVYRSDADARTLLRWLLVRLRSFIASIPDLFRRMVVTLVSRVLATVRSVGRFLARLIPRPVETLRQLGADIRARCGAVRRWIQWARDQGIHGLVASIRGQDPERDRLEQLWLRLKQELGLEGVSSVTPEEVRELALRQELPHGPATELVEAFRQEQYTATGYPGPLEMDAWERALWGEQDG